MRRRHTFLLVLIISICHPVLAQEAFPPDVVQALETAGAQRPGFERLLANYRSRGDKEQYAAACFLITNMVHHYTGGRVAYYDAAVDSFRRTADAAYYRLIRGTTAGQQESDPLHRAIKDMAEAQARKVQAYHFRAPKVIEEERNDLVGLGADFAERQIEQAFALRRHVARVRQLPFRDFLEYVLPYRAINGYPLATSADTLHHFFAKYLLADTARSIVPVVERYNRAVYWLRRCHGSYPFDVTIGFPYLFFSGQIDCIDQAEFCAQVLRACGIPAVVETNVAYRIWNSRHYMVAIRGGDGRWQPFNAEYDIPQPYNGLYKKCLNLHRLHFSRQSGNPADLATRGEPIPDELADPGLVDVTEEYLPTTRLSIRAEHDIPANHRLAYLASFRAGSGLVAVTWGLRKTPGDDRTFTFDKVVPDNIYFPVFCDGHGSLHPMAQPFCLRSDSTVRSGCRIEPLPVPSGRQVNVTLRRKYPRKPHLLELARRTVGTIVLGCDSLNFLKADTLAVITNVPEAEWTDLALRGRRPYRYYRVSAPKSDPHLHLGELQFLTRRTHGYSNVMAPTPLSGGAPSEDGTWQRLLDEPLEKCRWKKEYDGNVQTAPEPYPDVTLKLAKPQWVECLRFVVKHADNGVRPGDDYVLRRWGDSGWQDVWSGRAETNRIEAGLLDVGGLYWLSNLSRGNEELPFIINADGSIRFPHEWVVEDVESGRH